MSFPVNAIIFLAPISTFDQVLAEVGPPSTRRCVIALNGSEGSSRESVGRLTAVMEIDRLQ